MIIIKHVKLIALNSIIIILFGISFILYNKSKEHIQDKRMASKIEERMTLYSLYQLEKKRNTHSFIEYLKSSIITDIKAIYIYNYLNDTDKKLYCVFLSEVNNELIKYDATAKILIKNICKISMDFK